MNQVKKFVKWLIDNDIAFTNIDEAVRVFKNQEVQEIQRIAQPSTVKEPSYWPDSNTSCNETFRFTPLLTGSSISAPRVTMTRG